MVCGLTEKINWQFNLEKSNFPFWKKYLTHLVDLELLDDSCIGQMPLYINLEDFQAKTALYILCIKPLQEKWEIELTYIIIFLFFILMSMTLT